MTTPLTLPQALLKFVPDDFLRVIGLVATQWSILEAGVEQAIWIAAGLEWNKGRAITTHPNLSMRLDMLRALLAIDGRDLTEIDALIRDIKKKQVDRNLVVHAFWIFHPERDDIGIAGTFKARGELKDGSRPFEREQIEAIAADIAALTARFLPLIDVLKTWASAKPSA